ncbi:MAG: hypothetical protein WAM82_16605 [Thermoanaerobaculia bacterium]
MLAGDRNFRATLATYLHEYEPKVVKWGTLILSVLILIAVFLVEVLHVLPGVADKEFGKYKEYIERTIYALLAVIGLVVVRQIFVIAKELADVKAALAQAESKLYRQGEDLDSNASIKLQEFARSLSPKLHKLSACVESLKRDAEAIYPIEEFDLDWIGLDLYHAWKYMRDEILKNKRMKKINLRVLIIAPEGGETLAGLPQEAQEWRKNAGFSVKRIREWMSAEFPQDRSIVIELRAYRSLPVIHGFHIKKPQEIWYFSFCRWEGPNFQNYDWGEDRYRRITADLTDSSKDLVDIFAGQFGYLWANSTVIDLTSQTPPAASGRHETRPPSQARRH